MKLGVFAGHRGKGTGAVGIIDEGAETLILTGEIITRLSLAGVDDVLTDGINESLSHLVGRLKKEVRPEDITLDVHFNSAGTEEANGCEVLTPARATDLEKAIATDLLAAVCEAGGFRSRGVKTERQSQHQTLAMLSGFDCNNLLLEVCFVNNKADVKAYRAKRGEIAQAIVDTLIKYIK